MTEISTPDRTPASQRTMAKFLEAAEGIFGRHGYEGTSVREIAARAGVNLGTLKHYWGSKRELFRDLIERRLRPAYDEATRRLALLEASTDGPLHPDDVVACMVEPAFLVGVKSPPDLDFADAHARGRFHLFFGRCLTDPAPEIVEDTNALFNDVSMKFYALMHRACPELSQAELDWRINCIFGTVSFAQLYAERIGRLIGTDADVEDALAARWVMHFIKNGVSADPMSDRASNQRTAKRPSSKPTRKAKGSRAK